MHHPRFGTDGLRGVANAEVTAELATALGRAAARSMPGAPFAVGRDTRRSGPLIQAALMAGMASEGCDVFDLGVLPTPGIAHVAASRGIAGAVISASHNPFGDNGVKLFAPGGTKLTAGMEQEVESQLDAVRRDGDRPPTRPTGGAVGRILPDSTGVTSYLAWLRAATDGRRLDGMVVALDCAHGAASAVAPQAFAALGATVRARACAPDGCNINAGCGSTHPEDLRRAVVADGADVGMAFDGDADRLLAVDHTGSLVDGDQLLALFAADLASRGALVGGGVVVTVMTNLWFRRWAEDRGMVVHDTPVGDRHVLAALDELGWVLGGEQSGHIIFRWLATTGDGVLSALVLADLLARRGRPLADLVAELPAPVPQLLRNVIVSEPAAVAASASMRAAVAASEADLAGRGRILVRASGTEPLLRIMVEATDQDEAVATADRLCATATATAGDGT